MKSKPIIIFNLIAFSLTWVIAFWIYYLLNNQQISTVQQQVYHSFGALGPTIGAFLTAYLFYGKTGVSKLVNKIVSPKKLPSSSLLICVSPLLLFIVGLFAFRVFKGEWYNFKLFIDTNWNSLSNTLIWFLPLISYAIFEEIGWRGFLLPHFQKRYDAWLSTIYLTIIWGLWHLPFFFYRFEFSVFISIGFFFGLFVGAIILTSLYNSSRGSLLFVILFHLLMNIFSGFDKEIIVAILSTGYIFIAIYIYKTYGRASLSSEKRTNNYFKIA